MTNFPRTVATASSATVRIGSILFLRWFPGHHLPAIIVTAFVVYLTSLWFLDPLNIRGYRAIQENLDEKEHTASDKSKVPNGDSPGTSSWTLFTGAPSKRSGASTFVTVAINYLLVLLALDFVLRGLILYPANDLAFSRIGYVSPTTAKLLVREPNPTQLPLIVYSREAASEDSVDWVEQDVIYLLDDTTDFTYPATLKDLRPSTQYEYSLSNNMTGAFITAPMLGTSLANRLTFLTSSCMKPNFPYNPLSHPLRIPGIEYVSKAVAKLPSIFRPAFMLFLGDFIYIDVPWRLGSSVSHYRSEYRRVYSSPSWYEPQGNRAIDIPWIHILDDHEIANDWADGNMTPPYPAAADPYAIYHVSVNPPIPPVPFAAPENTTYFSFIHGPASFFLLDTRTYRSHPDSTMLGSAQLQSLLAYLGRSEPAEVKWKIVASSVPFTKNWRVGGEDTWGGYLPERRTLLDAMWRAERELGIRVVLLSGDRHEFGATRFPNPEHNLESKDLRPGTEGEGIHEFSVGPLNMFYLPIRAYRQTDDQDIMVKYAPDGNIKFGQIDIDLDGAGGILGTPFSVLTYSLWTEGVVVWKYQLSIPMHGLWERLPPGRVLFDSTEQIPWRKRVQASINLLRETLKRSWDESLLVFLDAVGRVERAF